MIDFKAFWRRLTKRLSQPQEYRDMSIEQDIGRIAAALEKIAAHATGNAGKVEPIKATPATPQTPATLEPANAAPTQADALTAMNKLAAAKGRDVVVTVLAKHKATKVSNMPPAEYAGFIASVNAELAS